MSKPIDIPARPSRQTRRRRPKNNPFPYEDGPFFGYIEIFEDGDICWMVSAGDGQYVQVKPQSSLPPLSFIVEKDRISKQISIDITSWSLKQSIQLAISSCASTTISPLSIGCDIDNNCAIIFDTLLKNYDTLKTHLSIFDHQHNQDDSIAELRLLVHDLLRERALFEGIGLQEFKQRGVLHMTQIQDMHHRSLELGLDEIEACFALGLVPDTVNERYLEAFNSRFAELARAGEHAILHDLCEPAVRSGEIEIQYNPSLLLEVLDRGHFETYVYLLDLVDRTRETSKVDLDLTDISFEPMYIAIRLGHLDVVKSFIEDNVCFEGRVCDDSEPGSGHVFTPISSAVFWDQPSIVRMLLQTAKSQTGTIYSSGYEQAVAMALAGDLQEIIQLFASHEQQLPPRTPFNSYPANASFLEPRSTLQSAGRGSEVASGSSHEMSRQAGYGWGLPDQELHETFPSSLDNIAVSPGDTQLGSWDVETFAHHKEPPTLTHHDSTPSGCSQPTDYNAAETQDKQPEAASKFAIETSTRTSRRKLGQDFVSRLKDQVDIIRRLCGSEGSSSNATDDFWTADNVWSSGIEVFRRIVGNSAPATLPEVVSCLLVADVLVHQLSSASLSSASSKIQARFTKDIGRWRSILKEDDVPLFDLIIREVWGVKDTSDHDCRPGSTEELYYFQELIQNIVSVNEVSKGKDRKYQRSGLSLRGMQSRLESRRTSRPCPSPHAFPDNAFQTIDGVLGRLTMNNDSPADEAFDIGDFIYLEELQQSEPLSPIFGSLRNFLCGVPTSGWKDINPTVVLLLASVAFCVILIVASGRSTADVLQLFEPSTSDYGRSCAIVESLFDFNEKLAPEFSNTNPAYAKLGRQAMKSAAMANDHSSRPLLARSLRSMPSNLATLRAFASSPGAYSQLSTSPEVTRSADRLPCLSQRCNKSFSSISNRNKHMRDGCVFREKKGYKCRNGDCTKVLTTKWYRNTHEQERCRYR